MAPMIGLIIAVIYGLSTDYEVFLVSRMVEARERGMSTAEAIRIGTATTGRLITAAALVLAVVAGAFVFSDLVMMKYLAFGLLIALLLDATDHPDVPGARDHEAARRRLLVGAALDEAAAGTARAGRDRPARRAQTPDGPRAEDRPWSARARRCATRPRPPHDPTHPGVEGASRRRRSARAACATPPASRAPPASRTAPRTGRTVTARPRVSRRPANAVRSRGDQTRPQAPSPSGSLRARPPPAPTQPSRTRNRVLAGRTARHSPEPPCRSRIRQPSADATRSMHPRHGRDATTAIPVQRANGRRPIRRARNPRHPGCSRPYQRPDAATERLNARGEDPRRRPTTSRSAAASGVSAQDLLRREGRL